MWQRNKSPEQSSYRPTGNREKINFSPVFRIIKVSLPFLSLSQGNQSTDSLAWHYAVLVYEMLETETQGQAAGRPGSGGEKKNPSAPPCGTAKSNLRGSNPHPLVQTLLKVPDRCLIDSDCVRGLGAVYTECQASARRMSVRTVVE